MSQYLHVRAGPYQMLLDVEGVHEILELSGEDDGGASGHRGWRGRVLTSINGRALLGLDDYVLPRVHPGVVYSAGEDETPVMLELDGVERLRSADGNNLSALPRVPEQAFLLFDGVLSDKGMGDQMYHLRRPLALADMMEQLAVRQNNLTVSPEAVELSAVELSAEREQEGGAPADGDESGVEAQGDASAAGGTAKSATSSRRRTSRRKKN